MRCNKADVRGNGRGCAKPAQGTPSAFSSALAINVARPPRQNPIAAIEPDCGDLEFNPPFLQAAGATEAMIVASFETRLGTEIGVATLCMPFGALFPRLQARGSRGVSASDQQFAARAARRRSGPPVA